MASQIVLLIGRLGQGLYRLLEEIYPRPTQLNNEAFFLTSTLANCRGTLLGTKKKLNLIKDITSAVTKSFIPILYCSIDVWHQRLGHLANKESNYFSM